MRFPRFLFLAFAVWICCGSQADAQHARRRRHRATQPEPDTSSLAFPTTEPTPAPSPSADPFADVDAAAASAPAGADPFADIDAAAAAARGATPAAETPRPQSAGSDAEWTGSTIGWDCFLPSGSVDCPTLETSFFGALTFVRRAHGGRPPLFTVRVQALQLPRGTRYEVEFHGVAADTPTFTLVEYVPDAAASAGTIRVLGVLQRGSAAFLSLEQPGTTEDGQLRLAITSPGGTQRAAAQAPTPFYLRARVSGSFFSSATLLFIVSPSGEFNFSDEHWRLNLRGDATYKEFHARLPSGDKFRGSFWSGEAHGILARSLVDGLSLALISNTSVSLNDNIQHAVDVGLGVEWLRYKLLRNQGNNFGFRYQLMPMYIEFVTPNIFGDASGLYLRHQIGPFLQLHTELIDIQFEAVAGLQTTHLSVWDLNGTAAISFRPVDGFEVRLQADITGRHAAINAPADESQLSALAVLLNGSNFVGFSYNIAIHFSYIFGNSLLLAQDQRWRH